MKKLLLIIYAFYIFYAPDFSFINPLLKSSTIISLLALINIITLNRKLFSFFKVSKLYILLGTYFLLAMYLLLLNYFGTFEVSSIVSNFIFILNLINFSSLLVWFNKIYEEKSKNKFIDFIILIGLIQAGFIFIMLIFPSFHEFGKLLMTQNQSEEGFYVFVLQNRSFGIGSSYTFMMPLIQAFISVLSLERMITTKNNFYSLFAILLGLSSAINTRTGIYILIILGILYLLIYFFTEISVLKIIQFFVLIVTIPMLINAFISVLGTRMEWLMTGIYELVSFFTGETVGGNVGVLTTTHLFYPKGLGFFFGTGQRVFGSNGMKLFGKSSDIGYINDLFKGGLIYIFILYLTQWRFIYDKSSKRYSIFVIIFLLISNYKGEALGGNTLVMIAIMITTYPSLLIKNSTGGDRIGNHRYNTTGI